MVQTTAAPTPRAVSAARVREALIDAALELFARDGFDATHADRVAERAGVSPRTFFRYFPTKESVVFHRDHWFMRSFAAAYLEQPAGLGDYDALHATFVEQAAGFGELRARIETYRAAVDSSPVLLGREQEHLAEHALTVSEAIARRRGTSGVDDDEHDARDRRPRAVPARAATLARRSSFERARRPHRRGVRAPARARTVMRA